jgi:hypothetical protein
VCIHRCIRSTLVAAFVLPFLPACASSAAAQSALSSTQTPPAPTEPAAVPLPNRLNRVLPPWVRLRADFRERMEGADNAGFVSGRDDLYWLSRLRVNATIMPSTHLSFQVQAQDARVAKKQIGATGTPFSAPIDLRTAFADIGGTADAVTMRVGRQELTFGEQRLVGHSSWANAARTFDGARLTVRRKAVQLDMFATSVVRILPDEFDRSGNGNRFVGVDAMTTKLVGTLEPYVFWRRDLRLVSESGPTGTLSQATTGVRWTDTVRGRLEISTEAAVQRGSLGADDVRAWAGHAMVRSPSFAAHAVRVSGEYNFASGDRDPKDAVRGTFDQLYPTPHDKYGLADQVGWRNIHHVRGGAEIARIKRFPITANYHTWWLADRHDGLYLATGALLARIPAGTAPRHVGQEADVQVSHALTPQLQVAAGYAYVMPGGFLKAATPGARYSAPFVMATYVFLAEK